MYKELEKWSHSTTYKMHFTELSAEIMERNLWWTCLKFVFSIVYSFCLMKRASKSIKYTNIILVHIEVNYPVCSIKITFLQKWPSYDLDMT